MSILNRNRNRNRIRIDASQLADELSKRLPDFDRTRDQAASAVHDAADQARHQIDRASEIAKGIREDIAHSAEKVAADNPIDEIGQRIRATSTTAVRALIARLEKELPELDRDTYQRAYVRGRAQARSKYLVVGLVAGIGAGAVAAILLDPKHGKERREAIARKTSTLARGAGRTVAGKAKDASERARGLAVERGVIGPTAAVTVPVAPAPPPLVPVFATGPVTDPSSTAWEPLPDSGGQALPTQVGGEALPAEPAVPAAAVAVAPALEAAGDHSIQPSNHG